MPPSYLVYFFLDRENGEYLVEIYISDVSNSMLYVLLPKRDKKRVNFLQGVEIKVCLFRERMKQKDLNSL